MRPRGISSPVPTLGPPVLPDPFDVLETTLDPRASVVPLGDVRVVRSPDRQDHPATSALHVARADPDALDDLLAELRRRFPTGRSRLVVPWGDAVADAAAARDDVDATVLQVLVRTGPALTSPREDVQVRAPVDDRDWHGITVLQRHAAPPGEDRARGAADTRLAWLTDGLRQRVEHGRARVLRAERFGTPAGVGVLHWGPGVAVGNDHAGLAVVADTVVHPAHRGLGVARTVVDALVAAHHADFPRALVTGLVPRPLTGVGRDVGPAPRGWQEHARLLALTRP